ncbi:MAG: cytochrome P450 [Cyanobacteria bacterium P01_C01_bin.118]
MLTTPQESLQLCLWPALAVMTTWILLRRWYFQQVSDAVHQIQNLMNGKHAPGERPKMLMGNIPDVYRAKNRLVAYNSFHRKFGDIVQIFWLWRHQLSISNYQMACQVLIVNQRNYQKFRPNSLLQKLFGKSVLTSEGKDWKRQRFLMNQIFSKKHIKSFHPVFVDYSERLVDKWHQTLNSSEKQETNVGGTEREKTFNIHSELTALFLDIIGKTALGKDFAALRGESDDFLEALNYIEHQSTQPQHQFVSWWKYLPLSSNRKLWHAFSKIDNVLCQLIYQRKTSSVTHTSNILDLLLHATDSDGITIRSLTDKEVQDNLLAVIVNGHETVATTVSFSLYLLAQHPDKMARAQAEVDQVMQQDQGRLTEASVSQLVYLNSVLLEVLRFSPAVAGLQRISKDSDVLGTWATPPNQVVGIALEPLHRDPKYFGEQPDVFHPERYFNPDSDLDFDLDNDWKRTANVASSQSKCPFKQLWRSFKEDDGLNDYPNNPANIQSPLTFGGGARKCLGEHFAMYEMKVTLTTLLYHFDFQVAPGFEAELELGKFGLFLSTFPKKGVKLLISPRDFL